MELKTKIEYYTTLEGKNPVSDFLDSLSGKQQGKVLRVLQTIAEYGLLSVLPHLKKLTGTALWEIRILGKDNIRIFYVVPYKERVLLLHGFIKKKQKTSPKEIAIALQRFAEWAARK